MTSLDAVRELALSLPRTTEALVRDRVKFRVGRIVWGLLRLPPTGGSRVRLTG